MSKRRSSPGLALVPVLLAGIAIAGLFIILVFSLQPSTRSETELPNIEGANDNAFSWLLSRLQLLPNTRRSRELVAVVVENHEEARRHQRGLENALLIEEFLVEGQISRFVAVFDAAALPAEIGPVRSLRPYFIEGLLPWAGGLLYAGGSPEAYERIATERSILSWNGLLYPEHFLRAPALPAPHDLFIRAEHIRDLLTGAGRSLPKTSWPPYAVDRNAVGDPAVTVDLNFLSPLHNVHYRYNSRKQSYSRENGNMMSNASPANIVVLESPIQSIGEHGRLEMSLVGEGRLLLFRGGKVSHGTWEKYDSHSPFTFLSLEGQPLALHRGQTWITIFPSLDRVTWQEFAE